MTEVALQSAATALSSGTRIGAFEVLSLLGTGGMGEVYRARDTRLNRDVAIKTLPGLFAHDADRLTRFEREAQVLASLNHPNIASLYGVEDSGELRGLVMELVEGPTLTEVIERAPHGMPISEVVSIGRQIIDALDAAHEHSVVHRDLKPGNVKITNGGIVKVLDFGLAKAFGTESISGGSENSPTITSVGTRAGVILGTAAYMSPEQARGQPVDKRADIWALGCVLFEMLTGRRPFEGDNVTDLLAGIVGRDPDFSLLPAATPPAIRRLLRRCLEKDRRRRLSDVADARLEIDEALSEPASGAGRSTPARAIGSRLGWLVAIAFVATGAAAGIGGSLWLRPMPPVPVPMRFVIVPPATDPLYTEPTGTPIAISPDGQSIVYAGVRGSWQLYLRRIGNLEAQPIPGTNGGRQPFFSPDGKSVGFWSPAEAELRKVSLSGGTFATICKMPRTNLLLGASWGPDDTIVFAASGLYRVSAAGGTPVVVTTPAFELGEFEHRWPEILPDGRAVLFTAWSGSIDRARIAVQSLVGDARKTLVEGGSYARYSTTGHLVYYQAGALTTSSFDPVRLEVLGDRVQHQETVMTTAAGAANFALSRNGTLVTVPSSTRPERRLVWVDRTNKTSPVLDLADDYWLPRVSPDGTRIALGIGSDIWVIEIKRGTRTRVTHGTTSVLFPFTWSHDSSQIIYSKVENSVGLDLYAVNADGSGQPQLVLKGEYRQWATSTSSSGAIATYEQHPTTLRDIWLVAPDRTRSKFLVTQYQERAARFSPDGKWLVYASNDSGHDEIFVRASSGAGSKTTVSTNGGIEPVWAASGRELFYREEDKLMVAAVETAPVLSVGRARALFEASYERDRGAGFANPNYDVARDGQRFVMIQAPTSSSQIVVVPNWSEELKARARAGG